MLDEANEAAKDAFATGSLYSTIFGLFVALVVADETGVKYVLQVGALAAAIGLIGGCLSALVLFMANV